MKKLAVLLLVATMAFGCVACGGTGNDGDSNKPGTEDSSNSEANAEIKDASEILTKAWEEYKASASEDIQFSIFGGNNVESPSEVPAKFDLSIEYAEDALVNSYCIPADTIAKTDDIATMVHSMMANNFSAAACHVTNAADVEAVVSSIKDATVGNQWMCGSPQKLIIVTVGDDYVVSAFGLEQVIDAFEAALETVYGDAAVVSVEENIAE